MRGQKMNDEEKYLVNLLEELGIIDKYYDELGHTLVSIKITSGNLQGFIKGNGQPLQLNDIIPISEVNNVTFTANNQSSPYTVSIGFVGINSNNEIVS